MSCGFKSHIASPPLSLSPSLSQPNMLWTKSQLIWGSSVSHNLKCYGLNPN